MQNYQGVGQLTKPPLVYTASFIFINLKNISHYIPKIQDKLRDYYPNYSNTKVETSNGSHGGMETKIVDFFGFNDPELKWGIILSEDRFIFHTVNYKDFSDFSQRFQFAFSCFLEVTGLKFYSGIAYRQIDNFILQNNEKELSDCVNKNFLGIQNISNHIGEHHPISSRQEHKFLTNDNSNIILRVYSFIENDGYSIPQDLIPFCVSLDHNLVNNNIVKKPYVLADFESNQIFDGKSELIDRNILIEKLDSLHQFSSRVFREVITPKALENRR